MLRRVAEAVRTDHGESLARVLHAHEGNVDLRPPLAEHAGRAVFRGHRDKAVAVCGEAGDRDEELPGFHLAGVVADAADLGGEIGIRLQDPETLQQIGKLHGFTSNPLNQSSAVVSVSSTVTVVPRGTSVPGS